MHDLRSLLIEHQVISISGRTPLVLLGLEAVSPEPVELYIAIDLSDSFSELTRLISHTKKLLNLLPMDWPVSIFALSTPYAVSCQGLRILDLVKADNWLSELCVNTHILTSSKRRGSFLRPVLEAIVEINSSNRRLLLVLTDGEFTDFGAIDVPTSVEVVCIVPNTSHANRDSQKPISNNLSILEFRDPRLDEIIARYTNSFFGSVVIEPLIDVSAHDKLYRITGEGDVISWPSAPSHIVNLASGKKFLLFDGSVEDVQLIRWKISPCSNQSFKVLQSTLSAMHRNLDIEESVVRYFTQSQTDSINELICWTKRGDEQFKCLVEEFRKADVFATQGKSWIDEGGSLRVFSSIAGAPSATPFSRSQYSALLAIMVQCFDTGDPLHIGLFSLRRDKRIAIHFDSDSSCHQLLATRNIKIRFDGNIYRWLLDTAEYKDTEIQVADELEYYASEKIDLPLNHPDGSVTALFSGNLI